MSDQLSDNERSGFKIVVWFSRGAASAVAAKYAVQLYGKTNDVIVCKGCVKATSPTYWNLVRKVDPDVFERRSIQSRRLGVRLVRYKGKRIFLDELHEF